MPSRPLSTAPFRGLNSKKGFTLVEMLVVLAVIGILLAIVVPSIVSVIRGQGVTRALDDLSATFADAKTQAMARNTWIWVGLAGLADPNTGISANGQLTVVEMASLDGTGTNLAIGNMRFVYAPVRIKNVNVVLNTYVSDGTGSPPKKTAVTLPTKLMFTNNVAGQSVNFNAVVAFSPQGEAVLDPASSTFDPWLGFAVAESSTTGRTIGNNSATIKLSGPTGECLVLRN